MFMQTNLPDKITGFELYVGQDPCELIKRFPVLKQQTWLRDESREETAESLSRFDIKLDPN